LTLNYKLPSFLNTKMDGLEMDFSKLNNYKTYNNNDVDKLDRIFNKIQVEIITNINDKIEIDTNEDFTIFKVKHNNKCTLLLLTEKYNFNLKLPSNEEKVAFNVNMDEDKELITLSIKHLDTYTIFKFKPDEYCINIIKKCNSCDEVDKEIKKRISRN